MNIKQKNNGHSKTKIKSRKEAAQELNQFHDEWAEIESDRRESSGQHPQKLSEEESDRLDAETFPFTTEEQAIQELGVESQTMEALRETGQLPYLNILGRILYKTALIHKIRRESSPRLKS